ncbi:hypothetical protein FNV43_RR08220 [Rhamnella rubrinervis]|uniref:Uncharacterized protein n=1 Tax=Rhamnella rubrinervis TaxID=2594499 RepID=A0A8K0MNG1_9ROSA|nr:hypothetical protein FNV43_RR08220 [Rhamnella rubrinervis]
MEPERECYRKQKRRCYLEWNGNRNINDTKNGNQTFIDGEDNGYRIRPTMEIESRMVMAGRARVLHFFTHHVDASASC